jgi:uncharacterized membrane protein YfcA
MDMVSAGLPLLGFWQFALLGLIAFLVAIVGGVSSFGAGLLVTPFLVPVVGIKGVVPIMSVAMLFGNSSRIWVYRHEVSVRPVFQILVPAMPGVVLGAFLNDLLPHDTLALVLGLFLLASIPLRRFMARRRITPTMPAIIAGSLVFGTVSGALPGGGVLVLPMLLGIGLKGGGLIGTDAAIGVCINMAKVLLFGAFSLLDAQLFVGGVLIGLCMIPGTYGARWLISRMHMKLHTALIEALIIFSGASFIWSALFG